MRAAATGASLIAFSLGVVMLFIAIILGYFGPERGAAIGAVQGLLAASAVAMAVLVWAALNGTGSARWLNVIGFAVLLLIASALFLWSLAVFILPMAVVLLLVSVAKLRQGPA